MNIEFRSISLTEASDILLTNAKPLFYMNGEQLFQVRNEKEFVEIMSSCMMFFVQAY